MGQCLQTKGQLAWDPASEVAKIHTACLVSFAEGELNLKVDYPQVVLTQPHLMEFEAESLIISQETPKQEQIAEVQHALSVSVSPIQIITKL